MKDYLDQFTRQQITVALIVAAVVAVEAVAYIAGGMFGIKVITLTGVILAALIGVVYVVCWLIDYLNEREWEEEHDRKGGRR